MSTDGRRARKRPALDRFTDRVDVHAADGCWTWTGYASRYGSFMDEDQRTVNAHRYAYLTLVEPIPHGMQLDHLCKNKLCVNPDHLEVVTAAENIRRAGATEAGHAAQTARAAIACPSGHPRLPETTYVRPDGFTECRICRRQRDAARRRQR